MQDTNASLRVYFKEEGEGIVKEFKLNDTDKTVIRQLTLLNLFLQHPNGLSFDEVDSCLYANGDATSTDSQKRKFHRDRETLADALGFYTFYNEKSKLYEFSRDNSVVDSESAKLTNSEKIAIRDVTLPHLLESYSDQTDLIIALNKLGVPFTRNQKIIPSDAHEIDFLRSSLGIKYVIWNCFITRTTAQITYTTAEGKTHEYVAQIYGTFSIGSYQYFVANIGTDTEEDIRTLRYDRVDEIKPLKGSKHYKIPEGYQDQNYLKLPFQIGQTIYDARVLIEKTNLEEFASVYRNKGKCVQLPNGDVEWTVDISDEDVFLYWLIAHGFIPIAPKSLNEAFINRLKKVVDDEEK